MRVYWSELNRLIALQVLPLYSLVKIILFKIIPKNTRILISIPKLLKENVCLEVFF